MTPTNQSAGETDTPWTDAHESQAYEFGNKPLVVASSDVRALERDRARLRNALSILISAEWMVTCDWTTSDARHELIETANKILAASDALESKTS